MLDQKMIVNCMLAGGLLWFTKSEPIPVFKLFFMKTLIFCKLIDSENSCLVCRHEAH